MSAVTAASARGRHYLRGHTLHVSGWRGGVRPLDHDRAAGARLRFRNHDAAQLLDRRRVVEDLHRLRQCRTASIKAMPEAAMAIRLK